MMKKLLIFLTMGLLLAFSPENGTYREISNDSFKPGEKLDYRVHYGLLNAATATMKISKRIYFQNGRPCYKVDIHGKSVGIFDLITRIRDNWGSYIDTTAIIPHQFYRNIEEGNYRKYEIVDFNHEEDIAVTTTLDKVTKQVKEKKEDKMADNVQDMVSGYYYLRTIDFSNVEPGQVISVDAFFDKEKYDFRVKFIGRETLRTRVGKFKTLVLQPQMPDNKLFRGENAIKVWLSDDLNKIPLKIKAEMFVGAVEIDIKKVNGQRHQPQSAG